MCGRYQLQFDNPEKFIERFDIDGDFPVDEISTSYNIAPEQKQPVVVSHSPNSVVMMTWGLIPFWEKSSKPHGLINVRDDTIKEKKWADKYITLQRCIVPSSGFYEWKKTKEGKVPYHIRLKTQEYISFAGIYSEWENPKGRIEQTYAIITTTPNSLMEPIHNRMPVILEKDDEDDWLNPDNVEKELLTKFLRPFNSKLMEAYPISTRVNIPSNNSPDILMEVQTN